MHKQMGDLSSTDQGKVMAIRKMGEYMQKHHPEYPTLQQGENRTRISKMLHSYSDAIAGVYARVTVLEILNGRNGKAHKLAAAGYVCPFWRLPGNKSP